MKKFLDNLFTNAIIIAVIFMLEMILFWFNRSDVSLIGIRFDWAHIISGYLVIVVVATIIDMFVKK